MGVVGCCCLLLFVAVGVGVGVVGVIGGGGGGGVFGVGGVRGLVGLFGVGGVGVGCSRFMLLFLLLLLMILVLLLVVVAMVGVAIMGLRVFASAAGGHGKMLRSSTSSSMAFTSPTASPLMLACYRTGTIDATPRQQVAKQDWQRSSTGLKEMCELPFADESASLWSRMPAPTGTSVQKPRQLRMSLSRINKRLLLGQKWSQVGWRSLTPTTSA